MQNESSTRLLRAVPYQTIELESGVLLKRGVLEVEIQGLRAAEVIALITDQTTGAGAQREAIVERFAGPDRPAVEQLIDQLIERNLLIPAGQAAPPARESELEIFYWNFDQDATEVTRRINERKIAIVGVNAISRQVSSALSASGVENVSIIDYGLLRNLRFFGPDGALDPARWNGPTPLPFESWSRNVDASQVDCLVATSDFGGLQLMRQWNALCVANRLHFLPVVLQNLVGYVGPLVVPGETACFECLRARQNAHLIAPEKRRAAEASAFETQGVVGFHPSMASVLGDIAALELTKFYGGGLPARRAGALVEVNLIKPEITTARVLKLPRCTMCSPLWERSAVATTRNTFLPGNQGAE